MKNLSKYYIVESKAMPSVFIKVLKAKGLIDQGKVKTVNEAVKRAGISRSAYYKYKDSVIPFFEMSRQNVITIYATLRDESGVLSDFLNLLAAFGANVLTINQNIPINSIANITVSFRTEDMNTSVEQMLKKLSAIKGVIKAGILAGEQEES